MTLICWAENVGATPNRKRPMGPCNVNLEFTWEEHVEGSFQSCADKIAR